MNSKSALCLCSNYVTKKEKPCSNSKFSTQFYFFIPFMVKARISTLYFITWVCISDHSTFISTKLVIEMVPLHYWFDTIWYGGMHPVPRQASNTFSHSWPGYHGFCLVWTDTDQFDSYTKQTSIPYGMIRYA